MAILSKVRCFFYGTVITNPNYAAGSAVMKYRSIVYRSYDYEARAKGDDAGINLGVARQNNVSVTGQFSRFIK